VINDTCGEQSKGTQDISVVTALVRRGRVGGYIVIIIIRYRNI